MAGTSYVPGTWLGVVRSGTAVLLGPDTAPALVGALWNLLADKPAVHEVLHAVSNSSGGSLASIPSFGILDFNSPLRVFLRGDLELTVELPGGPVELNGRDVTTWNERSFAMPGACTLMLPGAATTAAPELPLGEGVVLLGSLMIGMNGGPAALTAAPAAAAVVVDSAGTADMPQSAAEAEPAATFAVPAGAAAEADAGEDFSDASLVPGPEVSAETVFAVLDDDTYADSDAGGDTDGDASATDDPSPGDSTDPVQNGGQDSTGSSAADPMQPVHPAAGQVAPAAFEAAPASDLTSSYDHLWERTVMRNIEDAAVREDAEEEHDAALPGQAPALEPAAEHPVLEAAENLEAPEKPAASEKLAPAGDAGLAANAVAADNADEPDSGPAGSSRPAPAGVLIDSVPWRTGGAAEASPPAAPSAPPAVPQVSGVPQAPQAPAPPAMPGTPPSGWSPAGPAPLPAQRTDAFNSGHGRRNGDAGAADFDGDHDGQTVMKSSLAGMAAQQAPVVAAETAAGPLVLARVCSQGHPNPPTRAQCAGCGAALLPDAVQVARPRLGRMRLSTGELVDLDQSLVIGRQPSVSRVQGGVMPRLVQVASPGGDISRSHVEVRLEGWHVMLCDLKATNGTVLVRDGQPPRRLAQNEMAILLDGDIAELGDNISLRFEEIP
jgi:hypothetical protein